MLVERCSDIEVESIVLINEEVVANKDDVADIKLADTEENTPDDDDGIKAQEDVDKQRMEKVFRKQEEEWLNKREKVS